MISGQPSSSTYQSIVDKLEAAFSPTFMEVVNESYQHNVPPGSESHFKVILVTEEFENQRMVGRHRAIYAVLAEELAGSVHALALHTYTPQEWLTSQSTAFNSPPCRGGNSL